MEESWKGTAAFVATAYVATWVRYTKKPTLWVPGDHYTAAAERQHLIDVWDAKGVCDTEWLTNSKSLSIYRDDVPATEVSLVSWRLQSVIARVPTLLKTYFPSFFWLGNLQLIPFMANSIYYKSKGRTQHDWAYEQVQLQDGETVRVAYAGHKKVPKATEARTIIVIMHHGAGGRENDLPGSQYVGSCLAKGWKVISFVRRGHVGRLTRPKFNFFGDTEETRFLIESHVKKKFPQSIILFLGLSAGSALVARYMGEQGALLKTRFYQQRNNNNNSIDNKRGGKQLSEYADVKGDIPAYVSGAIGIAPGFNIETCMSRFMEPFMTILLWAAKKLYLGKNEKLLKEAYPADYASCAKAKTFQDWNDLTFRFAGFTSRDEYYDHNNPMRTIKHAVDPCLFINAQDDPICLVENLYEHLNLFDQPHCLAVAETATGSHCPFIPLSWNPITTKAWTEDVMVEFFSAVLAVEKERELKQNVTTISGDVHSASDSAIPAQ